MRQPFGEYWILNLSQPITGDGTTKQGDRTVAGYHNRISFGLTRGCVGVMFSEIVVSNLISFGLTTGCLHVMFTSFVAGNLMSLGLPRGSFHLFYFDLP